MSEAEAKQGMETYFAALLLGAQPTSSAFRTAVDALQREQNSLNPAGCVRAAAVPATMPPLALRGRDGNVIALPAEALVNLGRKGLLADHIQNTNCVSKVAATLVRDEAGLRLVALGKNEVAVVTPRGSTERLQKKGDVADVRIGDRIVLLAEVPPPGDEAFELIEVMDVEAPAAAPEISQPPAAVDQAQAAALTSDASMAAPTRVPVLTLGATHAAPVEERFAAPTQRGSPPRVGPPPSPLDGRSPMKVVEDALPHQRVKKGRAEKGAVETVTKEMTPADKRRAAMERHRKVAAVLSLLEQYHATAPEASVETALDANDDSPTAAAMWLLDPKHTEKYSVRPVERA